jgi:hypothetical protein
LATILSILMYTSIALMITIIRVVIICVDLRFLI